MIRDQAQQLSHSEQQKQSSELIYNLKEIIAEQQSRIQQLERDLKKWEKRYKEQFYKESPQNIKYNGEKSKNSDLTMLTFIKQLSILQEKYDKKNYRHAQNVNENYVLKDTLKLIQKLYKQLEISEKNYKQKIKTIDQQSKQIENLKIKMQSFLNEYESAMERSQAYETKLLEQIRRQEIVISRFRQ